MINVIATIQATPGYRSDVLAELLRVRPYVLAEEGCYQYQPFADVDSRLSRQEPYRADTIVLLEQWESVEHLKAHLETPHMKAYQEVVAAWVQDVNLQVLQAL